MQRQRQCLRRRGHQLNLRTRQLDLAAERIGCELLVDQLGQFGALPARQRQDRVHARQRIDAPFHRIDVVLDFIGTGEPHDRLRQRQRVLGAMIDLARQQILPLFRALAFGDVDGDAAHAHHAAALVDRRGCRADAPAHLAIGPVDAKLAFIGVRAGIERGNRLAELVDVVGMQQRLDVG